ncbi:hypothetical protein P280DRAFT_530211 [Massarina eburnea CBS 473.64]|uniref:peptidylprolyl isomerase n=1 Tax=Massarina eburnea CBS 473.64 TaxID=1395130 RepID=A0A6A6RQW7_9PLEO|nr:hypothetical protein P280DRAFT_530211 [Massarina eburnea CBS 473.64]
MHSRRKVQPRSYKTHNTQQTSRPRPKLPSRRRKMPTNPPDADKWETINRELNHERQRSVAARERSRREQKFIPDGQNSKSVGLSAAAMPFQKMACGLRNNSSSISAPILWGALLAGMPALVEALVATSNEAPEKTGAIWVEAVPKIVGSMGLGGATSWLATRIYAGLLEFAAKISSRDALKSLGSMIKKCPPGLYTQATIEVGYNGILTFWHIICWLRAKSEHDDETTEIEAGKVSLVFSVDNAVRILAHVIAVAASSVLSAAAPAAVRNNPIIAMAIPALAWTLADVITHALLKKKVESGGWKTFVKTGFGLFPDRRRKEWVGKNIDEVLHTLPSDMFCGITQRLVVDPVRSTFTGHVYERTEIFRWLDSAGTDPMLSGEKATRLDYISAPVVQKWAYSVAQDMGGRLEVVPHVL